MSYPITMVRADGEVVETYERLSKAIDLAQELWRLLGDYARCDAIEAVSNSAFGHTPPTLRTPELEKLYALVAGLDAAIVGPLTDEREQMSPDKVRELRGKTSMLDLDESRGDDARWAVSEALFHVIGLQNVLKAAIDAGNFLVFQ